MKGDVFEVVIRNNYDSSVRSKRGEGIGLRNIRDRLQIIYNNPLLMKVEDNKTDFKVTLAIPQN
jgi:sensor histidine kinase YesM